MQQIWDKIKERPALAVQTVQAVLSLLVAFGVLVLSDNQTAAVLAFTSAGLGFILALAVRPFSWSFVTGLVQAGIVLVTAFGLELDSQQIAGINAVVTVLGAFLVQSQSTPETHLPALAPAGNAR